MKIIHETRTVREFESEAQFEAWYEKHTIACLRAGFSRREMERIREPQGLTIVDAEQGVLHTRTTQEVKRILD